MKTWWKRLIILYIVIILLKISLSYFIPAPSEFSDYYTFAKIARSVLYSGDFTIHGQVANKLPLYSILLSMSYFFKDMAWVYFFMKVINALISSLIIIPAWLLSREFFSEKRSFVLTVMIAVLPAHFSFTYFIMAENLFYPLFLFSIYLAYKSFTERDYKWDVLAGVFIGLSYLTKIHALLLPLIVICVFLFKMFRRDYKEIYKKWVMAVSFLIIVSPWLIRNGLLFGFNKSMLLGSYDKWVTASGEVLNSPLAGNFLLAFLTWFVLYAGYLMIASGFLFFIATFLSFSKQTDKKTLIFSLLTSFSVMFFIFLASRSGSGGIVSYPTIFPWLTGRVIGRYVETVIPLILINGLLGFKQFKRIPLLFASFIFTLIVSSQLIFFQLFPMNNMSLTWLGVFKFVLDFLIYKKLTFVTIFSYWYSVAFAIIFVAITLLLVYLKNKLPVKRLLYLFVIFFFLVNLLNFTVIYYNVYTFWYKGEQTQLGLWFNKYDPEISTVLFDERDGCKIFKNDQKCIYNPFRDGGSATVIGFWMNDEIRIGSVDNLEGVDYVVSRHKLDLLLLKETKNGIFLYKTNRDVNHD